MINRITSTNNISYRGKLNKQIKLPKIHIKKFSDQCSTMQKVPKVANKFFNFVIRFLDTL